MDLPRGSEMPMTSWGMQLETQRLDFGKNFPAVGYHQERKGQNAFF